MKTPIEVCFICLGNKEIYCIFGICCIISVLFFTKFHLFPNFTSFCSNNTRIFLKLYSKFKYAHQYDKGYEYVIKSRSWSIVNHYIRASWNVPLQNILS